MTRDAVDVLVAGAGPAGASLAARLARRGREVVVLERGRFPRDKLCGEFLSPEAMASLEALGVPAETLGSGAARMSSFRLTAPGGAVLERELPAPAWGVTRRSLDAAVARAAREAGADVREGCRVTAAQRTEQGFVVDGVADGAATTWRARVFVNAAGRDSGVRVPRASGLPRDMGDHVAFKRHHRAARGGPAGVEIHAFRGGYCGVGLVDGGVVNACFLARASRLREAGGPHELLARAADENAALAGRLDGLEPLDGGFLATARMTFVRKGPSAGDALELGDAAAMIAPACGDGMAMALRGAEMALPLVLDALDGRRSWDGTLADWRLAWRAEFGSRLRLGDWLQRGLVRPSAARALAVAGRALPLAADWLVRSTRG